MEQFRQIGEVVGSLNAWMVFQNQLLMQRQCCLLVDMLTAGYKSIAEQMKHNLKYEERTAKWKILEQPLKELLKVYKEGEAYIKMCLETKDWWAKAIALYQNSDCVELHIHNLLTTIPAVVEAIEMAGMISGTDQDEMLKKKAVFSLKYNKNSKDPRIFQWMFGQQYLVTEDFCTRLESVWDEDRWFLLKEVKDRKNSRRLSSKHDRLADLLLKYLSCSDSVNDVLLPSAILVNSKDYKVRRRLGTGKEHKEIQWLGESFALRHFHGDVEALQPDICSDVALSHPNIMHILCGFTDEEKKECFLVMELMHRELSTHIKETCGPKKRVPFSIPVAIDLLLQIARGMEYLHSKKIYHGELNPSNILIKPRPNATDGYLLAKISGFGLSTSIRSLTQSTPTDHNNGQLPYIWYAPEVLSGQEMEAGNNIKYTEKCDVYSFGMVCFEVLTGKVPFEDAHLQGDNLKMSRNIRAGERPLFPSHSPKFITNLTKKCWHTDPAQRPSFSSVCRMLRYTKRFLAMNPEYGQQDAAPTPPLDFSELEATMMRSFLTAGAISKRQQLVSQIPHQMFTYRVIERERGSSSQRDTSESGSDGASTGGEEATITVDDSWPTTLTQMRSLPSIDTVAKKLSPSSKSLDTKKPGTPKGKLVRPPHTPVGRPVRMNSESRLTMLNPRTRRRSGPSSDSELS